MPELRKNAARTRQRCLRVAAESQKCGTRLPLFLLALLARYEGVVLARCTIQNHGRGTYRQLSSSSWAHPCLLASQFVGLPTCLPPPRSTWSDRISQIPFVCPLQWPSFEDNMLRAVVLSIADGESCCPSGGCWDCKSCRRDCTGAGSENQVSGSFSKSKQA